MPKLLLIEDDETLRECCQAVLTSHGYEVVTALELLQVEALVPTVDGVVSDFNMGMDFQIVRSIAGRAGKPLLLMSGNPDAEKEHERFLPKPFTTSTLLRRIQDLFLVQKAA